MINWNGYISRWLGGWVGVGGAEKGRQEQNSRKTFFLDLHLFDGLSAGS